LDDFTLKSISLEIVSGTGIAGSGALFESIICELFVVPVIDLEKYFSVESIFCELFVVVSFVGGEIGRDSIYGSDFAIEQRAMPHIIAEGANMRQRVCLNILVFLAF